MRIRKRKLLALICFVLLGFIGIAQNHGAGQGNGLGNNPPPPVPPPPPGLPIDGAIPVALVLAAYFGIKKSMEINK